MKFEKNKKYLSISIYAFLVIIASITFYLLASRAEGVMSNLKVFSSILTPITLGFVMAYLFNFILRLFEERLLLNLNIKQNLKRFLSLVLTYVSVLLVLLLFMQFVLPQLVSSLSGLVNDIPSHVRGISYFVSNLANKFKLDSELNKIIIEQTDKLTSSIVLFATNLVPKIGNITKIIISSISNIILGLIISIYVLIDKEKFAAQSKKMISAILPKEGAIKTLELVSRADRIFGSFLSGKILDSLIIGVLTFVILLLVKMPYAILVSFIIGISNIIPFFGPFIGAIPAFFIILFVSPQKAILFLVLIIVIQQIDGNIIGPKILGDSLGISPFWILFSLLITGKILGFVGLIIGVPLFVFIYSIVKDLAETRLKKKGLPTETSAYKE